MALACAGAVPTVLGWWSGAACVPAVAMGNLLGGFPMLALCVRLAGVPARGASMTTGTTGARAMPCWRGPAADGMQIALGGLTSASCRRACLQELAGLRSSGRGRAAVVLGQPSRPGVSPCSPRAEATPVGALATSSLRHAALMVMPVLLPVAWVAECRLVPAMAVLLLVLLAAQPSRSVW